MASRAGKRKSLPSGLEIVDLPCNWAGAQNEMKTNMIQPETVWGTIASANILYKLGCIIHETIKETDLDKIGVPEGHIYAALIDRLDLTTFERIIAALVKAGKLRKCGNLLFAL